MDIKKELSKKWETDYFQNKLKRIEFKDNGLRGVSNIKIDFNYPITVIAGANGIGKTTILQTLACLYHNEEERKKTNKKSKFKPYRFTTSKNQKAYYTFSDFFIQKRNSSEECEIEYEFQSIKNMKKTTHILKKVSKWNNYDRRPDRYVDYYGVSRIIPSSEFHLFKKTFTSENKNFIVQDFNPSHVGDVKSILSKPLSGIQSTHLDSMPNFKLNSITLEDGTTYNNFNMGAGEEVIISLISRINEIPEHSLVLIEELELGLHPKAQKLLLDKLYNTVLNRKIQLIFTTHSPFLFKLMPKESRILLKKVNSKLEVIYGASDFITFNELLGETKKELTIYVEDNIAKNIISNLFNSEINKRINIVPVGSKENTIRMIGAHIRNPSLGKMIVLADGDLTDKEISDWYKKYVLLEQEVLAAVLPNNKVKYINKLPGDSAPEKYILEKIKNCNNFISDIDDTDSFKNYILNEINLTDHHNLFFEIAQKIGQEEELIKHQIIKYLVKNFDTDFSNIKSFISESLEN